MIKVTNGGEILSAVCAGILMDPSFRFIRFELFLSNSRDTLNGDISTIET